MQTTYLASKPRYEILDGLRGVAALIVVAYHLFETYATGAHDQVLNHGYLAVDFFFVLSGFVVGYAYDDRWNCMTTWGFFKRRLVRLHPLIIVGTLIGMATFYLGGSPAFPIVDETPWYMLLLVGVLGMLMIPLSALSRYSRLAGLCTAQWCGLVVGVGILCQHPLCCFHPSLPSLGFGFVCSSLCVAHCTPGF